MAVENLITEHIDIWTSAVKTKSTSGRGSSNKLEPYGVKKLRELILELAVRGKLVPQDPNDEPASVLLERIAQEKAQLVKEKKIKKPKKLPNISDEEKPFDLPNGWKWVRFPDVAHYEPGKTPATKNSLYWDETGSGIPWVSIADLNDKSTVSVSTKKISDIAVEQVFKRTPIPAGTMLMSFKLTVGKISILNVDAFHNEAIISVFPYTGVLQSYLFKVLPSRANSGNKKNAIMGFTLNAESLSLLTIPLPPEAEQHRIVAKVDELMALCDQLEQQTEASIEAHQMLVTTLLDTLTNSADADELMQNWARISEYFDTLFTTEESIDQLKQTILQLAMMGKLVPQDPNDEPAAELLKRIAEEKAQLVKEKKIKKQKVLPPISDDEKPFELPNGWEWCRFDEIIDQRFPLSYGVLVPGNHVEGGVPLVRIGDIDLTNPAELPEKSISVEIDSKYERTRLFGGEILMAVVGSIGKLGVVPDSWKGANIARALCRILPWEGLSKDFLLVLLQSNYMQNSFMGDTRTLAQPTLNIGLIKNSLTPIPPLSEQLKIVSMVSGLFKVCDNLKSNIKESQTIQLHLTDTIVEQAV
ncbi:restriction endonuclease subunit S [Vibrio parahaemolyticus]|uniref:Restriction endonuclease subunit S n=1 Tax=Vibrio parahaemolyticus TaxID=670 RepID=A0A9Q3YKI5_VIBPH|nr:restriction endonuclease subunit S [Vibrio parahaemolyticus]EGQ8186775.1 restriction endonuclease subunit S [Vibrio parahaemolyticus]EGQ8551447.1 restriction endonuclease subunit S [Vibrio parahaemolyticus]EGQ9074760.1 restriction endonuclease subunit S [Vibrio parahaemolyticus]EGQ9132728.1 restriction endonuclease subunit S [Vibrio parahaemolyticus]EIO3216458.1 restriction endonuclease subunit S [Vibrio parahaemolyticus]